MKGLKESTKNVIKNLKEETEYQKFFAKALKKYGKSSPSEMSDDEKKEFFDYVDRNWKGAHEESVEEAAENWKGRALRVGKSHVIEILPKGGKLYNKNGVSTLLSKEELHSFAKQIKEKNIPITEGLHMFSGNIMITKKRVLPLLKKLGINKVKVKSVGGMFMDVYFDADNEKFKEIQKVFAKNFGKPGSSSWKNLNMALETVTEGRDNIDAIESFMPRWKKALSKAKSAGIWSPHMRGDSGNSHGYTMSDFWGKVPDKIGDDKSIPVFGFHHQSSEDAFSYGNWKGDLGLTWGQNKESGKKIVKVLKSAGFKVNWNGSTSQKIMLVPKA